MIDCLFAVTTPTLFHGERDALALAALTARRSGVIRSVLYHLFDRVLNNERL